MDASRLGPSFIVGTLALAGTLAGCGGGGDVTVPGLPPIHAEMTGINDDPHWLVNAPGNPLDQSFFGYASPKDLAAYGISRVRFPLYVDGDDLNRAFAVYDPVIAAYHAANVPVLVVIGGMSVSLDPMNANAVPTDVIAAGKWHDFVVRYATVLNLIADHYNGQVDAYEIMNEMNVTNGAARYIPPDAYSELLQWAHDAVAGRARVILGGLYGSDDDGQSPGSSYLANVNLDNADAIAVHPYGYWPGPPETRPDMLAAWGTFDDVLTPLAGLGKPIWLTEWSIADDNLGGAEQTAGKKKMFESFFTYVASDARVEQAYFFAWSDHNESGFGLLDDNGIPKPYVDDLRNDLQHQIPAAPRHNLHGEIVDAATGQRVAPPNGVSIYTTGSSGVRARSDGTFELPGVAVGEPRTLVVVNDVGTVGYGAWTIEIASGVGVTGTIRALLPPEPTDPAAQAVGTVSGTVFDVHDSAPLTTQAANGAEIYVYCAGRRAKLAADGSYTIDNVRPGAHEIIAANTSGSYRFASAAWSVAVTASGNTRQDLYLPRK